MDEFQISGMKATIHLLYLGEVDRKNRQASVDPHRQAIPPAPVADIANEAWATPSSPVVDHADKVADAPRVFGTGLAAAKLQDDTQYKLLGRMDVECPHCHALHWIEVNNIA